MGAEAVELRLAAARAAREAGQPEQVLSALRAAWEGAAQLDEDHPLRQISAWRLAKAEFDLGTPTGMLQALEPILSDEDPFAHYPAGLQGAQRLAHHYWDTVGYDAPALLQLWRAYSRATRRAGDPYLAAAGQVQLAWQLAALGDREALIALMDDLGQQTADSFGQGPHRHARAADTPTSVFHVQLDLARTVLWAAVWMRDARLADEALQLQTDAAEDAGIDLAEDVWDLDPRMRALLAFDRPIPAGLEARWTELLARVDPTRRGVHLPLAEGILAAAAGDTSSARQQLLAAAAHAETHALGHEWVADALSEALRTTDPPPALRDSLVARLDQLIALRGVRAFSGALSGARP